MFEKFISLLSFPINIFIISTGFIAVAIGISALKMLFIDLIDNKRISKKTDGSNDERNG